MLTHVPARHPLLGGATKRIGSRIAIFDETGDRGVQQPLSCALAAKLPHRRALGDHPGQTASPPAQGFLSSAATGVQNSCAKRSEEHTSELQSLMRISYAVFCLKKKTNKTK